MPCPLTYVAALSGVTDQFNVYNPLTPLRLELNTIPASLLHHTTGFAVITLGVLGEPFTLIVRVGLVPQLFDAVTLTVPVLNVPYVMLTLLVP